MKPLFNYFLTLLALVTIQAAGQQNVLFNTYTYDPMQLNIAYAGAECTEANLNYRNQWLGLKDAPKLYQLNAHHSLGRSTGAGLRVASQQAGLFNTTQAMLGYGYRISVDQRSKVVFGIGVGLIQNMLNAQKAVVMDNNDVTITQGKQQALGFDSELGVQFLGEKIKGGFSVLHLYTSKSDFSGSTYKTLPQMNATLSYSFDINEKLSMEPMLVDRITLKGNNALEGIVNVFYNRMISLGAGYRSNYGLLVLAGIKIDKFKLVYSFDYGTSKNRTITGSSHQVLLGFYFCSKKKAPIKATKKKQLMRTRF